MHDPGRDGITIRRFADRIDDHPDVRLDLGLHFDEELADECRKVARRAPVRVLRPLDGRVADTCKVGDTKPGDPLGRGKPLPGNQQVAQGPSREPSEQEGPADLSHGQRKPDPGPAQAGTRLVCRGRAPVTA